MKYFLKFIIFIVILLVMISCSSPVKADDVQKVMFWGFFNDQVKFKLDDMDKMYGKKPAIIMWYINWRDDFPGIYCTLLNRKGYMPHIVWEAWYGGNMNSIKLADILRGGWDSYIQNWGKAAGEFAKPLMVRW